LQEVLFGGKQNVDKNMIGPLLIFDKSFLEMLNPDEVFELSMHFKFVGTPTLIGEIIADLKLEPSKRRVPSDVVRALSRKMQKVHGLQPANYRKLALANFYAHEISMIGQVPVDSAAPNVHVTEDGRGLLYDSTPEQTLWARWADGKFGTDDELTATTWRNGIDQVDLDSVATIWKPFTSRYFSSAKNQSELISAIDLFLKDQAPAIQRQILNMTLDLLKASGQDRRLAHAWMNIGEMRLVLEFAPYAASVTRLFLAFAHPMLLTFLSRKSKMQFNNAGSCMNHQFDLCFPHVVSIERAITAHLHRNLLCSLRLVTSVHAQM
jgi:hypothetical protein